MKDLNEHPHTWLNKQMGAKKPDQEYFRKGKEIHRIIQDHLAGIKLDDRCNFIDRAFEVVELEDFDPNCRFELPIKTIGDLEYCLYGFIDGKDKLVDPETILEIKSGSTLWSIGQYVGSIQRKLYGLANPTVKENYLVTVHSDIDLWTRIKPKRFVVPVLPKDREDALLFVNKAIDIIESGDFTSDLVDGKCTGFCSYGNNCLFK